MASRPTKQLFASLRASARFSRNNVYSGSRRAMSSTAEAVKKSSDMPWIIGSAVVFGPAFLYLVSPASRKSAPHHDSHGKHEKKGHEEPMPMKDDEGTETDVSESVSKAEAEDVPKADSADKEESQGEPAQTPAEEAKKDPEPAPKDPAGSKADPGPTEQGQVREKASESGSGAESPKGVDEKINKAKDESS
ncbi:hypothetical protein F5890DRAFT_1551898 [Lentinula detonsa]|uniref:Uncharacterized protein n=1 Tax=Lentinula detonsa TaxID=2804962 RepID=A0AA38Q4P7_9AGAR|nr:hypothetical protein F5890DRAFT_1551898 [Lentinula detonsa]